MNESDALEADEYKVYSDFLEQRLGLSGSEHPVVIRGYTTETTGIHPMHVEVAEFFEDNFGIEDILKRNGRPQKLEYKFISSDSIILLSPDEIHEAGLAPSGSWNWDIFRTKYRSAIYELSRVSFDKHHTLAHLYFGFQADWLVGYGAHFLLENRQGKWTIKSELPGWKS